MQMTTLDRAAGDESDQGSHRRRWLTPLVVVLGTAAAFLGYLRMSRTIPANADGASNAIQAWDMLHGNVLLTGWTVTDVSFYTTELIQYALLELVYGYRTGVIHVAAAMTYTLLLLLAALLAKGRATGREAVARIAVVCVVMLVPGPSVGYTVLLGSPDHFGTAVPLLVTWLVLDRAGDRRFVPWAVAVLLAWGMIADPLVMFLGALPLALVSAVRMVRHRRLRGPDLGLLLAAAGSVLLTQVALTVVRLAGGFYVHAPTVEVAGWDRLGRNAWLAVKSVAAIFGSYFPDRHGPWEVAIGVLHLVGLAVVLWAVVITGLRLLRRRTPDEGTPDENTPDEGTPGVGTDRVPALLAVGVLVNVGAFVVSTLPVDMMTTRQLVAVLPLGAALAGRVFPLHRLPRLWPVTAAVLVLFVLAFAIRSTDRPAPTTAGDVAQWLDSRGLRHGLGSYWGANVITLETGGRITVAPTTGGERILGYRWESREDWYDPARHDARFLVIDLANPAYGTVDAAVRQFGAPEHRQDFGRFTVLVYGRNLLVGLPAFCEPGHAPSMAQCPREATWRRPA